MSTSNTAPESYANPKPWAHVGLDYYRLYLQSLGRTVLVYSIVGTAARDCEEVTKGLRYQTLQEMIGTGFTAAICNDQIADNFVRIAQTISARGDCYPLAHPAVSKPEEMEVHLGGLAVPFSAASGFNYDSASNAICFSGTLLPPAGETLTVQYVWLH